MASMVDSRGHVGMSQVSHMLPLSCLLFTHVHTSASRPVTSTLDTTDRIPMEIQEQDPDSVRESPARSLACHQSGLW